jgi:hypothetical protein
MCEGCYEEYGRPAIITDRTLAAAELVRQVYDYSGVGGNLHIVLDDWNIEDDNLEFCAKEIAAGGYFDPKYPDERATSEQLDVEKRCCDALARMTLAERASALALYDGYLKLEHHA